MAPTRKERSEAVTRMRREQILDAALEVFGKKGFSAATTAEIARVAGVAEGTVFKYFPTKRDLFIGVVKSFVLTLPLMDLIGRLPQGDIEGTVKLIIADRMNLIERGRVTRLPLLLTDVMRDPELKDQWVEEFLQPFLGKLEEMYRMMGMTGGDKSAEPAVAVRAVGGMILGFLLFKVLEGDKSPLMELPAETVQDDFTRLLLRGLQGSGTE